jgi:hypothetical protein
MHDNTLGVCCVKYSDFLRSELFSSISAGRFNPNSLFTRVVSDADLNPSDREAYSVALSIHAHEYIHYLHNISTPSGVTLLLNMLYFFFEFMKGTDRKGIYCKGVESSAERAMFFSLAETLQGRSVGELPPNSCKIKIWNFESPTFEEVSFSFGDDEKFILTKMSLAVVANSRQGDIYKFEVAVGLDFLTEGVAHEVDRELRRSEGLWSDLDEATPAVPYLAYKEVVDFLLGRKSTAHERIVLGTCSLLSKSPGLGLYEACIALKFEHRLETVYRILFGASSSAV